MPWLVPSLSVPCQVGALFQDSEGPSVLLSRVVQAQFPFTACYVFSYSVLMPFPLQLVESLPDKSKR